MNDTEELTRARAALREIQLAAGHELTQLTSNHPYYAVFESFHRMAALGQLATTEVTNEESPLAAALRKAGYRPVVSKRGFA